MQYRVGIDIGGTFTDFVAFDEASRQLKAWKNLSTPRDPIEGVMTGLKAFGGTDEIGAIRLGTTVATNALLEGKGAVVALPDDTRFPRRAVYRPRQSTQPLRSRAG